MSKPLVFQYENWRGETAIRTVTPRGAPYFGATDWHHEPQWLMRAFDHDKGAERIFALRDCRFDITGAG